MADGGCENMGSIVKLSQFLQSPPGRYVLDWEQQHLDAAVGDTFGYHALQLGLPEIDALRENRMLLRFCASDRRLDAARYHDTSETGHTKVAVINRYEELPFASQSIDLVVMPHILEFADEPHQVLREVDRVLVPEGHVVITGFNPASLWGVRQAMARCSAPRRICRVPASFLSAAAHQGLAQAAVVRGQSRPLRLLCAARCAATTGSRAGAGWRRPATAGGRSSARSTCVTAVKRVRGMRLVGAVKRRTRVHAVD